LDEKRLRAIKHQKVYHAKLKSAFGKKIKTKEFKVGDFVLKENINKIATNDEVKGKFEPNWFGPFVIVEVIGSRAFKVSSMDGKEEPNTFNATHLKCFFV